MVFKIIEEAGNKGTWIRDIRVKSNLAQAQLTKVLKSLRQRKLIKEVKCVNSTRKIFYMLSNLEPDRSVTGGAWYSDQGRGGSQSFVLGIAFSFSWHAYNEACLLLLNSISYLFPTQNYSSTLRVLLIHIKNHSQNQSAGTSFYAGLY